MSSPYDVREVATMHEEDVARSLTQYVADLASAYIGGTSTQYTEWAHAFFTARGMSEADWSLLYRQRAYPLDDGAFRACFALALPLRR